jgi:hypothetical protein
VMTVTGPWFSNWVARDNSTASLVPCIRSFSVSILGWTDSRGVPWHSVRATWHFSQAADWGRANLAGVAGRLRMGRSMGPFGNAEHFDTHRSMRIV